MFNHSEFIKVERSVLFNSAVNCKSCIAFRVCEWIMSMVHWWNDTDIWHNPEIIYLWKPHVVAGVFNKCLWLPTKLFLFLHSILTVIFVWIFSIRSAAFYCKGWYNCTGQPWGEESDASRSVQTSGYGFRQQVTRSGPLAH